MRPSGLVVHHQRDSRETELDLDDLRDLGEHSPVREALPGPLRGELAPSVRWRRGADGALAQWVREGFDPTLEEVHALGLPGAWSSDPRAEEETWRDRATTLTLYGSSRQGGWTSCTARGWFPGAASSASR